MVKRIIIIIVIIAVLVGGLYVGADLFVKNQVKDIIDETIEKDDANEYISANDSATIKNAIINNWKDDVKAPYSIKVIDFIECNVYLFKNEAKVGVHYRLNNNKKYEDAEYYRCEYKFKNRHIYITKVTVEVDEEGV